MTESLIKDGAWKAVLGSGCRFGLRLVSWKKQPGSLIVLVLTEDSDPGISWVIHVFRCWQHSGGEGRGSGESRVVTVTVVSGVWSRRSFNE